TVKPEIFLHPSEIPSLSQNSHGVIMLGDFLNTLEKKGIVARMDNSAHIKSLIASATASSDPFEFAIYKIAKLDQVAEQKLLNERKDLQSRAPTSALPDPEKVSLADYKITFDDDQ